MRALAVISVLTLALLVTGCVSQTVKSTAVPPLDYASNAISEDEILDVGVAVLDPGITELDEDDGVFPEVRRAEATFIANELTKTLQEVGAWGAVRVVPDNQQFTDLLLNGTIIHSDGEHLELAVEVTDARGVVWIDKTYTGTTSRYAYDGRNANSQDPFLLVYRNVANDMLKVFESIKRRDRLAIRQVAELRFARTFASDAFNDYLTKTQKGFITFNVCPPTMIPCSNECAICASVITYSSIRYKGITRVSLRTCIPLIKNGVN